MDKSYKVHAKSPKKFISKHEINLCSYIALMCNFAFTTVFPII